MRYFTDRNRAYPCMWESNGDDVRVSIWLDGDWRDRRQSHMGESELVDAVEYGDMFEVTEDWTPDQEDDDNGVL